MLTASQLCPANTLFFRYFLAGSPKPLYSVNFPQGNQSLQKKACSPRRSPTALQNGWCSDAGFSALSLWCWQETSAPTYPHIPVKKRPGHRFPMSGVSCHTFFKNSLLLQQFVTCMNECGFILTACKEIPQVPAWMVIIYVTIYSWFIYD